MSKSFLITFLVLLGFVALSQANRFEFKHSFRSPFYLIRGTTIPFWDFGGSTVITEDFIRLTPALQSKSGWIWNRRPVDMSSWEVQLGFQIHGGGSLGADGLAFWYVQETNQAGPVYGSKNKWNGLGIFFDTFDNDADGRNPSVQVVYNDGSLVFDTEKDGRYQAIGSCVYNVRSEKEFITSRITYRNGLLSVELFKGEEEPTAESQWFSCVRETPVALTAGNFFGLSADTGGLIDNHDVKFFKTTNLMSDEEVQNLDTVAQKQIPPVVERQTDSKKAEQANDKVPDNTEPVERVPIKNFEEVRPRAENPRADIRNEDRADNPRVQELLKKLQTIKAEPREHATHADHTEPKLAPVDSLGGEGPVIKADVALLLQQVNQLLARQEEIWNVVEETSQTLDEDMDSQEQAAQVFSESFGELIMLLEECKVTPTASERLDYVYEQLVSFFGEHDGKSLRDVVNNIQNIVGTIVGQAPNSLKAKDLSPIQMQVGKLATDLASLQKSVQEMHAGSGYGIWAIIIGFQVLFAVVMVLLFAGKREKRMLP